MSAYGRAHLDLLDADDRAELARDLAPLIVAELRRTSSSILTEAGPARADDAFLSPAEVACRAGVNVETVRRRVRNGDLPASRIGRSLRIAPDDAAAWLKGRSAGRRKPQERSGKRPRRISARPMADALRAAEESPTNC